MMKILWNEVKKDGFNSKWDFDEKKVRFWVRD